MKIHMKRCSMSLVIRDTSPSHNKTPLHTHWDDYNLTNRVVSVGEDMEKMEAVYISGGNVKWCTSENCLAVPQKVQLIIGPSNPSPTYLPKRKENTHSQLHYS